MRFQDIIGQRGTANRLMEMADRGRVPHALLLNGRTGYGTLALALAWVQYLNCEHPVHHPEGSPLRGDSCGECPSCRMMEALSHPDLRLVFPTSAGASDSGDAESLQGGPFREWLKGCRLYGSYGGWARSQGDEKKKGAIRVKEAQEMIRALSLKSYHGGYKAVVVWMPELMNTSAANELLKTLEEPPEGSLVVLVGEDKERLLPTVVSRCQLVEVGRIAMEDLQAAGAGPEAALLCEGDWIRASELMRGQGEELEMRALYVDWMRRLFKLDMAPLTQWVDGVHAWQNRERQARFLQYCQEAFRRCFLWNVGGQLPGGGFDFGDEKFNRAFPARVTDRNIEEIMGVLREAEQSIGQNCYDKIVLMRTSFKLSSALNRK